jgi:hypothetical protein
MALGDGPHFLGTGAYWFPFIILAEMAGGDRGGQGLRNGKPGDDSPAT